MTPSSEAAGRITATIPDEIRNILFGQTANAAITAELATATEVDRAHIVMLVRRQILSTECAAALLTEIADLRRTGFAALRDRPAPRGLFMLYEGYLIDHLGADTAGNLHLGRSRNDLNATALRLRLRTVYAALLNELVDLCQCAVEQAQRHAAVAMPAYTHGQPAVPITFGRYLSAVASALLRDAAWLNASTSDLDRSPLGAGAVGGTTVPIDLNITAALLGFTSVAANSIDAVASRDIVLRMLAAAATAGVTMSRLSCDLFTWLTDEYGLIALPDHLVGSSSMMPQKRNPYLLEHVKGRSCSAAGAFATATMAMHSTSFTNSIAVGTESVRHFWPAMADSVDAATILRTVLAGVTPNETVMAARISKGYANATSVAEQLAMQGTMPFRSAHTAVGAAVQTAVDNHSTLEAVVAERYQIASPASATFGFIEDDVLLPDLQSQIESLRRCLAGRERQWKEAEANLNEADAEIRAGVGAT